jgi:hypothetical protein
LGRRQVARLGRPETLLARSRGAEVGEESEDEENEKTFSENHRKRIVRLLQDICNNNLEIFRLRLNAPSFYQSPNIQKAAT